MNESLKPGQTAITDYFDIDNVSETIEMNSVLRTRINDIRGQPKESSVTPLLQRLFENAQHNGSTKSKHANRHDMVVKQFAAALLILTGKSGYELLQANLGKIEIGIYLPIMFYSS